MRKVLIISPDVIGHQMAGPGIRYWQIAEQLSKDFQVTLMTPNECPRKHERLSVLTFRRSVLKKLHNTFDSILVQGMTLSRNRFLKKSRATIIVDLYDPFVFETINLRKKDLHFSLDLDYMFEQIHAGDYFICSSERQRDMYIGMLTALKRVDLEYFQNDKNLSKLIGVVPFGLQSESPIKKALNPFLKYSNIKDTDKVFIWGGGIWQWLDPLTLIRAFHLLSEERDDVKLFFLGVKHPNSHIEQSEMTVRAITLAEQLGIKGTVVFFEEWTPYDERINYLVHSYAGVCGHFDSLETRFSFRTRMLDYILCELPIITTDGDYFAELVKKEYCGLVVKENDVLGFKNAINQMLNNPSEYERYKSNLKSIKEGFLWEKTTRDLREHCLHPTKLKTKGKISLVIKMNVKFFVVNAKRILKGKGLRKAIELIKNRLH
ncbi:glycosyltransferase family 4 protein [Paenibacillus sp.]|uniref:glycosyltransferase family 4 protein n=1 Tax=Paenibacillus sp. TaxID=58172 RepID=UPI002810AF71|nr:glycosyltransferase family 4 protein [Paenibacillus sp.]